MINGKIITNNNNDEFCSLFVEAIKDKKIVVFPYSTCYTLCFDLLDEYSKQRAYFIKCRSQEKKFSATIPSQDYLKKVGIVPNELERRFMNKYWPGQLKIAFTSDFAANEAEEEWLRNILKRIDTVVATTSANKSGGKTPTKTNELNPEVMEKVDLIFLDDKKIIYPQTTTIVRLKSGIEILRHGAVDISEELSKFLK